MILAAAVALICALLIGCTGGDKTPSESESETETAVVTQPVSESESESESEPASETESETETETETEAETTDYFEANRIELVTPDTSKVPDMAVIGEGYDIYCIPDNGNGGYHYGASYLYNDDGSVDAYFACNGIMTEWDWIAYRHSDDNGKTWTREKIVMSPTPGSMDHFSCCDPDVVYFNGYYYLTYTSTMNPGGTCNNIFVARSETPDGPFEKWNGSGWGGANPQPLFYYDGSYQSWGMGEACMIELNGTLYLYYTCSPGSAEYTMLATADAADENWPLTLQQRGAVYQKRTETRNFDSLNVKYVEDLGKFIALTTGERMGDRSWLAVLESNDGLSFELVDIVRENTYGGLHSSGLSSRRNGHIRLDTDADRLRVLYAYGMVGWGKWNTRVQPITLGLSDGNDMDAERAKSCVIGELAKTPVTPVKETLPTLFKTGKNYYEMAVTGSALELEFQAYDAFSRGMTVASREVTFSDYDESVIRVNKTRLIPVGVGETRVTVTYKGLAHCFWLRVVETKADVGREGDLVSFELAMPEQITLYKGESELHRPQIRARLTFADGQQDELNTRAGQDAMTITLTEGDGIITIDELGVITACEVGTATVTVTYGEYTRSFTVTVTDDPADGTYRPAV